MVWPHGKTRTVVLSGSGIGGQTADIGRFRIYVERRQGSGVGNPNETLIIVYRYTKHKAGSKKTRLDMIVGICRTNVLDVHAYALNNRNDPIPLFHSLAQMSKEAAEKKKGACRLHSCTTQSAHRQDYPAFPSFLLLSRIERWSAHAESRC